MAEKLTDAIVKALPVPEWSNRICRRLERVEVEQGRFPQFGSLPQCLMEHSIPHELARSSG